MSKTKSRIPDSVSFHCETCNKDIDNQTELIVHLQDVHFVDTKKPMTKQLMSHINGVDYYMYNFKYTTENGTVFNTSSYTNRDKKDIYY